MAYPRGYSTEELEKEVDKYGNESPHNHLGPSYYARASLGLSELERRSTARLGKGTFSVSVLALVFSIFAVTYTAKQTKLAEEQTRLTEIQSRSERVMQARSQSAAVERCKNSPELQDSGLYETETGKPAPCSEVLKKI